MIHEVKDDDTITSFQYFINEYQTRLKSIDLQDYKTSQDITKESLLNQHFNIKLFKDEASPENLRIKLNICNEIVKERAEAIRYVNKCRHDDNDATCEEAINTILKTKVKFSGRSLGNLEPLKNELQTIKSDFDNKIENKSDCYQKMAGNFANSVINIPDNESQLQSSAADDGWVLSELGLLGLGVIAAIIIF